ncbi:aldolase [Heliocybe sulcata]|uniref:Aldolase n=1 Tax=Heliocybe sulcata TaxID=5364 RepID=A0A5C3MN04_9AGAM|nr:aldolase [Heliocybe sulcata]
MCKCSPGNRGHFKEHQVPAGIYANSLSFLNADGSIDVSLTESHALSLVKNGISGIFVGGNEAEIGRLEATQTGLLLEHLRILRGILKKEDYDKYPLIAVICTRDVQSAETLCKGAEVAGASHVLVLPPLGATDQSEVDSFFEDFMGSDTVDITVMICDSFAGPGISLRILKDLATKDPVVGCCFPLGDSEKITQMKEDVCPSQFRFVVDTPSVYLSTLELVAGTKGPGLAGALANIAPKVHRRLWASFEEGNLREAQGIQVMLAEAERQGKQHKLGLAELIRRIVKFGSSVVPDLPVAVVALMNAEYSLP